MRTPRSHLFCVIVAALLLSTASLASAAATPSKAVAASANPAFKAVVSYAAGIAPFTVAIGDLTEDGKLDIATGDIGINAAGVLVGSGTGTFSHYSSHGLGSGQYPDGIAIGDLNGDGAGDVVTANGYGTVTVLLNGGSGAFEPAVNYQDVAAPIAPAIADVNGDGNADLVVANVWSTAAVFIGRGDGTFADKVDYATGLAPAAIAVCDLDSDGHLDFATANKGANTVSVFLGIGDGTFYGRTDFGTGTSPTGIAAGDVNADGRPDLLTANTDANSVSVLGGKGDGSFFAKVDYAAGSGARALALGDFSGDGRLDVVTANVESNVSELLGAGDGSFGPHTEYATGGAPTSVASGDLDGDGRLDLVTSDSANQAVSVLLGNNSSAAWLIGPSRVLTGQKAAFDASASTVPGGTITRFEWDFNGDGTFEADTGTTATATHAFAIAGTYHSAVRVTRGDGSKDLAWVELRVYLRPPSGAIGVSINNGDYAVNTANVRLSVIWPAFISSVLVSDDAGFESGEGTTLPIAPHVPWILSTESGEQAPKTVFLRFPESASPLAAYSDSIIFDKTAPVATDAHILGRSGKLCRVRVIGSQMKSGISVVQISSSRSGGVKVRLRPRTVHGLWRLSTVLTVRLEAKPRFARLQSAAGTWSGWRRVR
jgi:hypothetical protein